MVATFYIGALAVFSVIIGGVTWFIDLFVW